jgi:hypothetical protein
MIEKRWRLASHACHAETLRPIISMAGYTRETNLVSARSLVGKLRVIFAAYYFARSFAS